MLEKFVFVQNSTLWYTHIQRKVRLYAPAKTERSRPKKCGKTPHWLTLQGVRLRTGQHLWESDSALANTPGSQTPLRAKIMSYVNYTHAKTNIFNNFMYIGYKKPPRWLKQNCYRWAYIGRFHSWKNVKNLETPPL